MAYISGEHDSILNRLWQLPTGTGDVNSFLLEAQNDLALGNLTSGHRGQIDQILRLKKFQFDLDASGLAIPQL